MTTPSAKPGAPSSTDRIETCIEVTASRARVWRALADSTEFGTWFGITIDGPFTPGVTVYGRMTRPNGDTFTITFAVEQMQPEVLFSYRWRPYAMDPAIDYSAEPMTLVEFRLAEIATGTAVVITESGFDGIPLFRRAEAFAKNTQGWAGQSKKLAKYVG
jgi:uncharacterized protein YndB with AHSA1/START domain